MLDRVKILGYASFVAGPYCTRILADYGADVVCFGHPSESNTLIQVKHHKGSVENRAVGEIVSSKPIYEKQYSLAFEKLVIITNNYFTEHAKNQARANNVDLIDRDKLTQLLMLQANKKEKLYLKYEKLNIYPEVHT